MSTTSPIEDDPALLERLRAGEEEAFAALLDLHHATMVRVAGTYVRDRAVAEEVVQETWLAVVRGVERFEGRSTLRTWLFRILVNRARTRGAREGRSVPFSALAGAEDVGEPAVDPGRFVDPAGGGGPGQWAAPPRSWEAIPDERLLSQELLGRLAAAIERLPDVQREVIRLRDVEGWSAEEVCGALELSDGNQRVLLHRARSKVRAALEGYLEEEATT